MSLVSTMTDLTIIYQNNNLILLVLRVMILNFIQCLANFPSHKTPPKMSKKSNLILFNKNRMMNSYKIKRRERLSKIIRIQFNIIEEIKAFW